MHTYLANSCRRICNKYFDLDYNEFMNRQLDMKTFCSRQRRDLPRKWQTPNELGIDACPAGLREV